MQSLGIDQLPLDQRLALVHEIWESITAESKSLLTDAQRAELERRLLEDDKSPDDVIPWEQAEAEILAQLKQ